MELSDLPPLSRNFFARDTRIVAQELLNALLVKQEADGTLLAGRISETEAYLHDDPACHAFRGKTPRNAAMFGEPGHAYLYFTYGMHYCFNAVTEPEGIAGAVLVRALEPLTGGERMAENRGLIETFEPNSESERIKRAKYLCGGPAKLCRAFGLSLVENETDLTQTDFLWIARNAERFPLPSEDAILSTPRIGISLAQDKLWRYTLKDERFASRPV